VLENAVRYTPPDQPVTLRIAKNDYWLDVTVQNKSFSPLPDNTESFFQKFCHGSANVNTISPGLGLYLTRSIVKQHGGNLEMTTDENRNVIAKIRLPLKTYL
jgi:K+-sensing histidine kinase KdpD